MIKKKIKSRNQRRNSTYFSLSNYTFLKTRLLTHSGWARQNCCCIFKLQFVNLFGLSSKYGIHGIKHQRPVLHREVHSTATV